MDPPVVPHFGGRECKDHTQEDVSGTRDSETNQILNCINLNDSKTRDFKMQSISKLVVWRDFLSS